MKIGDPKLAQQLSLDQISAKPPVNAGPQDSPEQILEVARSFESLFINEIMKNMRKTLPQDGLLNSGFANNVFNSMLDQEYSQIASRSGQFGLANAIARQLGGDPAEIARREEVEAEKTVMVDGEEIPAWALEEIRADPWSPGAAKVDPRDPQQVTPGLSAPADSEFSTSAQSAPNAVIPKVSARARQAYEQLTRPADARTHAKR
jgi:flagellar protein FlgJ